MKTNDDVSVERDLGPQPLIRVMEEKGLKSHDLVAASTEHITHKMVARACKGRRLTPNVQAKIVRALNLATGGQYAASDLFNYTSANRKTGPRLDG